MKVAIVGVNKGRIETLLAEMGFLLTEKNPEYVISYGGDGTLMRAERAFPGVPKIVLKDSAICKRCSRLDNDEVLRRFKQGDYTVEELWKLEGEAHGKRFLAMNDVVVHNKDVRHAIRYHVTVNGKPIGKEIIGDGVVIATPFGSTAYYRSITDSFFEIGIGLAFNNSTEQADHMVLKESAEIQITIARGPALMYADNDEREIVLAEGDVAKVKKSREIVKIVRVD